MKTITYKLQPALQLYASSSRTFEFEVRDNSYKVVDLTDMAGKFKVFQDSSGSDSSALIDVNVTITDAEKGQFTVELDDANTAIDTSVYYYLIEFVKSVDETLIFGKGVFDVLGDDDTKIMQIKRNKGLAFEYYLMKRALDYAHSEMKLNVYVEEKEEYKQKRNEIIVDAYVADINFDGVVDEDDIKLIQYQTKAPYGVNDLSANIDYFIPNHPNGQSILVLDGDYPDDGFTLQFVYYKSSGELSKFAEVISRLEELYVMLYLISNVEANKLQRGIVDKTILGENIRFSQDSLHKYREYLQRTINSETLQLRPFEVRPVRIPKTY